MHTLTVEPRQVPPPSLDRRLYALIHGLPHSPAGDRYVALLSDLGRGARVGGRGRRSRLAVWQRGRRADVLVVRASVSRRGAGHRVDQGRPRLNE
jgi:hypothetical protein